MTQPARTVRASPSVGQRAIAILAIATTTIVAGAWRQPGFDAQHSGFNPKPGGTTIDEVASLELAWRDRGNGRLTSVIVVGGTPISLRGNILSVGADSLLMSRVTIPNPCRPSICPDGTSGRRFFPLAVDADGLIEVRSIQPGGVGFEGTVFAAVGEVQTAESTYPRWRETSTHEGRHTATIERSRNPTTERTTTDLRFDRRAIRLGSGETATRTIGPIILGNRAYVVADTKLLAVERGCELHAATRRCTPALSRELGPDPVVGLTAIGGDRVVLTTRGGRLRILDASDGASLWGASTGMTVAAGPAVTDEVIFVGGSKGVRAFDTAGCSDPSCPAEWSVATAPVTTQPAVAGGVVYVGTDSGRLIAIDAAGCANPTCSTAGDWRAHRVGQPSRVVIGPVVQTGRVYVGLANNDLVMFARP